MPTPPERGPLVDDADFAFRAILTPTHWCAAEDRPSTAAFDDDYFSVDLKSRSTPAETVRRKIDEGKTVHFLVEFNCGEARVHGFETRDEPDLDQPNNPVHAHVYNIRYNEQGFGSKRRKTQIREFIKICRKVGFSA